MESLKEVYGKLTEQDHVKEAQAQATEQYGADFTGVDPDLIKQAQDYDHIGRVLAHHVMTDLVKEALEEEAPGADDDEKEDALAGIMAKARGEKSEDDKDKGEDKESDEYKKKMKAKEESGEGGEEGEKKASIKAAILDRMAQDPDYVSHLIAKHYPS